MADFTARDGQFWLDGEPLLLQAGEFHYFRGLRETWRHKLGLLQGAGFNAVATYIPWLWHEPQQGEMDFVGRTHPQRDLAGFLDLAAEMGFLIIARPGPYIMAETINEGIPPWVFEKHPQAAFVNQDSYAQNIVSYLHPDFLSCVREWYRGIFEVLAPRQVTRGGRIVMVQLDNEMGMIAWVRNIIDTNPDTLTRFAAYLYTTYDTRLRDRYPVDDLAPFLRDALTHPQPPYAAPVVEDYRRFYRGYLAEYAAWLWNEARANGMEVPSVINIHGFANGGKTFPIGLSQLVDVMRLDDMISATDVYPLYIHEGNFHQLLLVNEMTKALQNGAQPLFSIEFQAGGNLDFSGNQTSLYDLHTRLCVSTGMRAINHYLFGNGENDPVLSPVKRHDWGHPIRKDGTVRRHYWRYGKLSQTMSAYGKELVLAQPQTVTTIGFQIDAYMTEVNNAATSEATRILTHQRDAILFDFIARGLALTHRPFDAIELQSGQLDPAATPLLWAMMERQCDAATQQKLVDYARDGGRLVLVGRLPEEEFDHTPCALLREALGVREVASDAPFTPSLVHAFSYRDIPALFVETYSGEFDEVFATRGDGEVVGFIQVVGRGRVMVLGAAMGTQTLEDLDVVNQMALRMGCAPLFELSDWADVRISRGERGAFLFINNYQDDPIETTITGANEPLFGGNPVSLPARSGAILPLGWQAAPGIILHYLTSEIREITDDGATVTIKTALSTFDAEVALDGYRCAHPAADAAGRVRLRGSDGLLTFTRATSPASGA